MNWEYRIDGLDFQQQTTGNHHVGAKAKAEILAMESRLNFDLVLP